MHEIPHNENNIVLLIIGAITGLIGVTANDVDLLLGICLKFISIVSFLIVIVINIPKFISVIKSIWKK